MAYKQQCQQVNSMLLESKSVYYNSKINEASGNQKELFTILNKVLTVNKEPQLPSHTSLAELTDKFADFLMSKILDIREQLKKSLRTPSLPTDQNDSQWNTKVCLSNFEPASIEEISKLIRDSPNKSCSLDPIPTWLTKKCIDVLAPLIMEIVDLSLSTGKMPDDYKNAVLIPLLKKISLDQEIFNNFRPISNLVYISKLIEKVIASRLHSHMTDNNLYEELQSSYRKFHSTETALTCVHDDILRAIDENKSVLLIMLDLSAAFDTVDHDVLLERLKSGLGICGTALNWFKSYLSSRSQSVLINGTQLKPTSLVCGIPQGSVLGPILFTIYMLPLGDIIKRHGMQFHMYADDCQLYTTFEASDINQTALNMEILIDDIRGWYSENMLKLNDSKTEMMVISSKFRPSVHLDHIKIGESSISPSETVRNLGVIMDSNYTMVSHINHKVQESFLKIRELSYYRRYLTDESSKTAVHAYVTSRLDYFNSLLYGLPKELSKKLQSVMNTAARLFTRTRKFDHITPVLHDLHWLPIESRSKFKILLLVYKCLYGLAPSYLSKRLSLKPNRGLRSDDKLVLNVPTTKLKTKTYGDRCFSIAGPNLWNQLPSHIRLSKSIDVFKRSLKTHLFKDAFNL